MASAATPPIAPPVIWPKLVVPEVDLLADPVACGNELSPVDFGRSMLGVLIGVLEGVNNGSIVSVFESPCSKSLLRREEVDVVRLTDEDRVGEEDEVIDVREELLVASGVWVTTTVEIG